MQLTVADTTWEWIENWAKLPPMTGHAHHGLVISRDGTIVTGHATEAKILFLDKQGTLLREFAVPLHETHGICLREVDGQERILIADIGEWQKTDGRVIETDLAGNILAEVTKADLPYSEDEWFSPTSVAWDRASGEVWIADGYGKHRVHKLTSDLQQVLTINGEEGDAGRFSCPHWVFVDTRKDEPEIYIADRSNDRVQVYGRDGVFRRVFGEGQLVTPSVFGTYGDRMVIGELKARLVVLDRDDTVLGFLGSGQDSCDKPGWPNRKDADGNSIPPHDDLVEGRFNSPHGMACDANGDIYVSEWLLGDRFIKLSVV